ncbi:MAG: hypothetical protein HYR72_04045 [Deltaproteobacteria bacterium]|nr:hypothetical protein [Deltaproteobacteria bacterium]MBI3388642.1 hypothetical protein [Deltaproteobacteria bacterium]
MRGSSRTFIAIIVIALLVAPAHAVRRDAEDEGHRPIVITGAVLTNIVYLPLKLVYSIIGGVTGVLVYAVTLGDADATQKIWDNACRGTYIVTPEMMEGKDDIRLRGP